MTNYTAGQVIDKMNVGEVAIKVDGDFGKIAQSNGYSYLRTGMFYDENDGNTLKSLEGNIISLFKGFEGMKEELFVIMSREAYERVRNNR